MAGVVGVRGRRIGTCDAERVAEGIEHRQRSSCTQRESTEQALKNKHVGRDKRDANA